MNEPMHGIDEDLLLRVLKEEEENASSYYASEIASKQTEAMDRFHGKLYGDEQPNRSRVVTRDIQDTINWLMPHLMRVFTSSDDVISCDDDGLEDNDPALDTAAKYLRHVFFKDNRGEEILHDFIFDGLLQRIGVARVYWEDGKPSAPMVLEGLPLEQLLAYVQDPNYEVLEVDATGLPAEPPPPQQQMLPSPAGQGLMGGMPHEMQPAQADPLAGVTVSVKVRKRAGIGRGRVEIVPPEEFRISRRAKSIDTADYHGWKVAAYLADLIGDHPEKAYDLDPDRQPRFIALGDDEHIGSDQRRLARFPDEPDTALLDRGEEERRKVYVNIEYVRGDFDGDNTVELRRIKRVGDVILENEVVDDTEFVPWSPIRVSHRLIGISIADTLVDIQEIRTVLTRKAMDGLTQTLGPRTFVNAAAVADDTTILDRILDHDIGDVIPVKGNPRDLIYTETVPDVSAAALNATEYWDRRSEEASGVNRHAMGIQPQAITQTKGGIDMLQAAANSRVEQVARWAASGFEAILTKLLRTLVMHQDQPRIVKIAGKRLQVDPRRWSDEMTVSVHVGLAAESREKKIGYLGTILNIQKEALAGLGPGNPVADLKHIRHTAAQMITAMGWKNPAAFFGEVPQNWKPAEGGQDPKLAEIQGKQQLAQQEMEARQQLSKAEFEANAQKQAAELDHKRQMAEVQIQVDEKIAGMKLEAQTRAAEMQAALKREIEQMRMAMEERLAFSRQEQERHLAERRMDQEAALATHEVNTTAAVEAAKPAAKSYRPGGRLDA